MWPFSSDAICYDQVIEDIRKQQELLADASDAEDDLGSLMVRTFVPQTPKLISKSSVPSSTRKL